MMLDENVPSTDEKEMVSKPYQNAFRHAGRMEKKDLGNKGSKA
jgi:hypothetical protein